MDGRQGPSRRRGAAREVIRKRTRSGDGRGAVPLRDHRTRAQWDNWTKDLRTELYQTIYEQPIYPKNLYLDRVPYTHAEFRREVIDRQIRHMVERDIWVRPSWYGSPGPEPAKKAQGNT